MRGWLQKFLKLRDEKISLGFDDPNASLISGRRERNKYNNALIATNTAATMVRKRIDRQF